MTSLRMSPPVASMKATTDGFIIDFSTAIVSSLSPFSSITGATCAIPSLVRTPRIVRTGANRPGTSRPIEQTSSARTTRRLDCGVINGEHIMPFLVAFFRRGTIIRSSPKEVSMRRLAILVTLGLLFHPTLSRAQTGTGRISGVIKDASGAVVPGVTVSRRRKKPASITQTVTTDAGLFVFPSLPVGPYTVKAELQGFRGVSLQKNLLTVGADLNLTIVLEPGNLEQAIVVSGESPVVQTTESSLEHARVERNDRCAAAERPQSAAPDRAGARASSATARKRRRRAAPRRTTSTATAAAALRPRRTASTSPIR